jgi:hypothetical protein
VLEGRSEAVAGTFNAQEVEKCLLAACMFYIFQAPEEEIRLVHTLFERLVSLGLVSLGKSASCLLARLLSIPPSCARFISSL